MRADRPEVDLLVFDEPASGSPVCVHRLSHPLQTSSLDAHAQNNTVDTIQRISASPSGHRSKTVIFITHRLSTARRADKIAMMERGVRLFCPPPRPAIHVRLCRQSPSLVPTTSCSGKVAPMLLYTRLPFEALPKHAHSFGFISRIHIHAMYQHPRVYRY